MPSRCLVGWLLHEYRRWVLPLGRVRLLRWVGRRLLLVGVVGMHPAMLTSAGERRECSNGTASVQALMRDTG